ncbi:exopolysaccharide biosynthesis polyprenyl glycosylphosphotransferase [Rubellimicrobium rubrum]|uniref:Exopolysaccharide biosynthesis polyprenyl glycosylphosphotransferase n=2 Tax=Rubellimicrobium rubrum TaxID=2585369 RepID=A0A5C4MSG8_9RHOB|nr:exopolysaccharide biosynthesis polyprenyl glycosylphosphotransferase [Rubellimicrobium rubrum]
MLDVLALALGLWFARLAGSGSEFAPLGWAVLSTLEALGTSLLISALGAYRLNEVRQFWSGMLPLLVLGVALATLSTGIVSAILLIALTLMPARALSAAMAGAVLDFGLTERRAVIVGGGEPALRVMAALAECPDNDIRVVGIFDDRDDVRSPIAVGGVPKLGNIEAMVTFARSAEIEMLIVALPLTAEQRIRTVLKTIEVLPVDVRLADFSADPTFRRHGRAALERGLIDVVSRPIIGGQFMLKRVLDIAGATVALLVASPVMLFAALAIRLESEGPVLFRQPRHGYNNRSVTIWKFRSMYADDCDPHARSIVTRGDPRVTRVGRFLRRTSIDELPQLFNVLRGDLSLVGPRPHALRAVSARQEAFEDLVDGYASRHRVRPGITGLAQINGWRGEIDEPEALRRRVEQDLYYIENWSIRLDLYILLMTPFRLLDGRRAY